MSSAEDMEDAIRRASCQAPETVRRRLWNEIAERQPSGPAPAPGDAPSAGNRTALRGPAVRIALAALIGTGVVAAAAVGVRYKYHFLRTEANGYQVVEREDGRKTWNLPPDMAGNPQQAVETAEELDLLKQEGQAELVRVGEIEVNGRLDSRMLTYRYNLSHGRTFTVGECDPGVRAPATLVGERLNEAARLVERAMQQAVVDAARKEGGVGHFVATEKGIFRMPNDDDKDVELPTTEHVVLGRTFAFEKHTFTLSDGTAVTWSIGRLPKDRIRIPKVRDTPTPWGPIPDDLREWASLRKQGKGQLIGVDDLTSNGQFVRRLLVYRYQLSDGRTLEMPERAGAVKSVLSPAQRQEWDQAKKATSGQALGTYEEQAMGRTFLFTRQRFVLSDGTEILWSLGKPRDNP